MPHLYIKRTHFIKILSLSATDPRKNPINTPLHARTDQYIAHTHARLNTKTNLQANEAHLSSVMTPVLAWQDVYTHNHGRASDVGRDEKEMRGEENREAETWRWASGAYCFSLSWQEDSCNSTPLRAEEREREIRTWRRSLLKRKKRVFALSQSLWTQPHSPILRKTIRSTRFPLSRSVNYKWANLAFITSLQTFIKAGSPIKLRR